MSIEAGDGQITLVCECYCAGCEEFYPGLRYPIRDAEAELHRHGWRRRKTPRPDGTYRMLWHCPDCVAEKAKP